MESKYAKYEKEILEMYFNGKAPAEIVKILNEKDPELEAEQNSLRVYIKRSCDKKNETEQTNDTKTVPENQERAPEQETHSGKETPAEKTVPEKIVSEKTPEQKKADARKRKAAAVKKMEEMIANEVEKRIEDRDALKLKGKLNEAYGTFSILNHEFGDAVAKVRSYASRCKVIFFIAGAMMFIVVLALFTGYHIHCCRQEIAFYYIVALCCGPAGILIGITIGFIIADIVYRKRLKKLREEFE
jgi:hypothetical protein